MLLNPTGDELHNGAGVTWCPSRFPENAASGAGIPPRMRLPGWILIGSTGRKSGKTEFACAIIRAFRRQHPIVAIKVTAITEGESTCPRGGEGCGACATLEGDFHIGEERGEQPGKDTARMLESGAQRVFWIRCKRSRMRAALEALLPRLGQGVLVVAESNSLAQAIEPDLFLMVTSGRSSSVKPSAAKVLSLAQRVVVSENSTFVPNPRQLAVIGGMWHLVDASAAILAGGKSSRMGQDKSLLALQGEPLIHQTHLETGASAPSSPGCERGSLILGMPLGTGT